MNVLNLLWLVAQDAFWSALAAAGFALVFNVPRRTLIGCLVCGAVGHAIRALITNLGGGVEAGTLAGAVAVGFLGVFFARRLEAPAPIFHICGAIPMVPGSFAYRAMIGLITVVSLPADQTQAVLLTAGVNAIKTGLILGAIAVGIAAPTLLFRPRRPVV